MTDGHRRPGQGRLVPVVERVVSGGQTGVDRAALDAALAAGLPIGGWVPAGRRAEDGKVSDRYSNLREAPSPEYSERTELNVRDSDATLVFFSGTTSGGTAWTREVAVRLAKPVACVDLLALDAPTAAARVSAWLDEVRPSVLNVAGPRESEAPGLGQTVRVVLQLVLTRRREC